MFIRAPFALVSGLLPLVCLSSCGSRTALPVCLDEGVEEACGNACGEGLHVCVNGDWTPCEVPDTNRTCKDVCGQGTQTCHDGMWQTCAVPPAVLACSNACGEGTQRCTNGTLGACDVPPAERPCSSVCGTGTEYCLNGVWANCNAPLPKAPMLQGTVRDFHASFPDMELPLLGDQDDKGLVSSTLGVDDKPVYEGGLGTRTTSGRANFDQWYRDVPGVNMSTSISIPLTALATKPGTYQYRNLSFFPIDNQLFGNEGRTHNFHFTFEIATRFKYSGGERFTFSGDDDVWVFLNRRLVIDLGGIHTMESSTVDLDSVAPTIGIERGNVYAMHIFFAERHTLGSDFVVETTIDQFANCD